MMRLMDRTLMCTKPSKRCDSLQRNDGYIFLSNESDYLCSNGLIVYAMLISSSISVCIFFSLAYQRTNSISKTIFSFARKYSICYTSLTATYN